MIHTHLVAIGLTLALAGSASAADPLDAARQLYLTAAYEEALVSLSNPPSGADADQVDKLRALCLLALGRRDEATKALESLATRRPLLQLDDTESPKLVMLYREARTRVLPPAAKSLYAAAKGSYERGDLDTAKQQFGDVLTLLADPVVAKQPDTGDLKMLAEGFTRLLDQQMAKAAGAAPTPGPTAPPRTTPAVEQTTASRGETAAPTAVPPAPRGADPQSSPAATPPPAQPPVSQPAPAASTPPPAPAPEQQPVSRPAPATPAPGAAAAVPAIFTADDPSVMAPVPVEQRLPPWVPPANVRNESLSGSIEVIIDETGKVASAVMSKSVHSAYDRLLLAAAKRWQYRPAVRNGRTVKFRRVVAVVLSPGGPE